MVEGEQKATMTQAMKALPASRAKKVEGTVLVGRKPRKMVAEAVATARMRLKG